MARPSRPRGEGRQRHLLRSGRSAAGVRGSTATLRRLCSLLYLNSTRPSMSAYSVWSTPCTAGGAHACMNADKPPSCAHMHELLQQAAARGGHHAHVAGRVELGAALAHNYVAGPTGLAAAELGAQELGLRAAPVARAAARLFGGPARLPRCARARAAAAHQVGRGAHPRCCWSCRAALGRDSPAARSAGRPPAAGTAERSPGRSERRLPAHGPPDSCCRADRARCPPALSIGQPARADRRPACCPAVPVRVREQTGLPSSY